MSTDQSKETDDLSHIQKGSTKQSIPTEPLLPDYLKRLNAKLMNDRVGQCFVLMNIKKRLGGLESGQNENK